jgi:hypothetical protein
MTTPDRRPALYRLTRTAPPRDHHSALAALSWLLDRIVARIAAAGSRAR